jgi:hypothetical protein
MLTRRGVVVRGRRLLLGRRARPVMVHRGHRGHRGIRRRRRHLVRHRGDPGSAGGTSAHRKSQHQVHHAGRDKATKSARKNGFH